MTEQKKSSTCWTIFIICGMIGFGTVNTITLKGQTRQIVYGHSFVHPFFQCLIMMMGEYLCLVTYAYQQWRAGGENIDSPETRKAQAEGKAGPNRLLFCVPATFDVMGSTCNFFGLSRVSASVYQMMRAFMIVITTSFSVIFLKRKYHIHHMVGVSLVIGGVIIIGTVSISASKGSNTTTDATGIFFVLIAQLFSGCMFVTEEKIIKSAGHITPLFGVGMEGLSGCTLLLLLLPILNQIPCAPESRIEHGRHIDISCPYGSIEDCPSAIAQIFGAVPLCLLVFASMCSIALFNFCGLSITQVLSSSSRAVLDPTRTLFIWIMSICLGWEHFLGLQLLGFLLSTTGMLIFNEFLPIPFLGMDYNMKGKIDDRNKRRVELISTGILKAIEPSKSEF